MSDRATWQERGGLRIVVRATWQERGGVIRVVRATCSRTAGQDSTGVIFAP